MTPRRPPLFGTLLAVCALIAQLAFGSAMPGASNDIAVATATALCHSDDDGSGAPAPIPHTPDCVLCPVCLTIAQAAFLLPANAPAVPAPRVLAISTAAVLPPATAPPGTPRRVAQPRAPPLQA